MPTPASDEGRHEGDVAAGETWWNESWYFDFATADGSLGGYVRLGLYPNQGVSWYWAMLVGRDRPLVALKHHDAPLPRGRVLELRSDGLWSHVTCETPHDHWSIGLESFAISLDDPAEVYRSDRGDRVAFGLDLEWEAVAEVFPYPGTTRYEQSCRVHGEVLVGDERIDFDGFGQRDHSWGVRDWWAMSWTWTAGRLGDGTAFHAASIETPSMNYSPGYVVRPDGSLDGAWGFEPTVELGAEGFPIAGHFPLHDLDMTVTPEAFAPVLLVDDAGGRVSRFPRALCRFETSDGRSGYGWTEWNQPQPPAVL